MRERTDTQERKRSQKGLNQQLFDFPPIGTPVGTSRSLDALDSSVSHDNTKAIGFKRALLKGRMFSKNNVLGGLGGIGGTNMMQTISPMPSVILEKPRRTSSPVDVAIAVSEALRKNVPKNASLNNIHQDISDVLLTLPPTPQEPIDPNSDQNLLYPTERSAQTSQKTSSSESKVHFGDDAQISQKSIESKVRFGSLVIDDSVDFRSMSRSMRESHKETVDSMSLDSRRSKLSKQSFSSSTTVNLPIALWADIGGIKGDGYKPLTASPLSPFDSIVELKKEKGPESPPRAIEFQIHSGMYGWKLTAEKRRIKLKLGGGSGGSGSYGSNSSSSSRGKNHGPLGYGLGPMLEIEGEIDGEIGGDMYESGGEGGGGKDGEDSGGRVDNGVEGDGEFDGGRGEGIGGRAGDGDIARTVSVIGVSEGGIIGADNGNNNNNNIENDVDNNNDNGNNNDTGNDEDDKKDKVKDRYNDSNDSFVNNSDAFHESNDVENSIVSNAENARIKEVIEDCVREGIKAEVRDEVKENNENQERINLKHKDFTTSGKTEMTECTEITDNNGNNEIHGHLHEMGPDSYHDGDEYLFSPNKGVKGTGTKGGGGVGDQFTSDHSLTGLSFTSSCVSNSNGQTRREAQSWNKAVGRLAAARANHNYHCESWNRAVGRQAAARVKTSHGTTRRILRELESDKDRARQARNQLRDMIIDDSDIDDDTHTMISTNNNTICSSPFDRLQSPFRRDSGSGFQTRDASPFQNPGSPFQNRDPGSPFQNRDPGSPFRDQAFQNRDPFRPSTTPNPNPRSLLPSDFVMSVPSTFQVSSVLEPHPAGTIVEGPFRSLRPPVPTIDPNGRMYNISKYPGDVRALVTTNDRKLKTAKVKYVVPDLKEEEVKIVPRKGGYGGRSLLSSPVSVSLKMILAPARGGSKNKDGPHDSLVEIVLEGIRTNATPRQKHEKRSQPL